MREFVLMKDYCHTLRCLQIKDLITDPLYEYYAFFDDQNILRNVNYNFYGIFDYSGQLFWPSG